MPIPSEKDTINGCFLKITFPKEIVMPDPIDDSLALAYQSADDNMMSNSQGGDNLNVGNEVFEQYQ
jgi:hypothetical protein